MERVHMTVRPLPFAVVQLLDNEILAPHVGLLSLNLFNRIILGFVNLVLNPTVVQGAPVRSR